MNVLEILNDAEPAPRSKSRPNTKAKSRKPRRDQLKPGECLCDFCTGKCCRYFSLPIDAPTGWDDYDAIRWYLAHGQTVVYVHEEQWYLLVMTECQYLLADNRCGIYLNRPKICREYTTEDCEYDAPWSFEKVFETPEQIWEYAEALLPARRRPARNGDGGSKLPIVTIGTSVPIV
jgi:Fe-S-cluster containining protein